MFLASAMQSLIFLSAATVLAQPTWGDSVSSLDAPGVPSLYTRPASNVSSSWPHGPFNTRGRDVIDANGQTVTWAGVNWPGSGETMVPEGLEWASVEDILELVKSAGFNFIRL